MKTGRGIITVISILAGMLCAGTVVAGNLTPSRPPGPTMHTLKEIYDLVDGLQQQIVNLQQQLDTIQQRQGASGMAETVGGMVLIPAGAFRMGDAFTEGEAGERPVHTVSVSAFYMDQYPVTKALWDEVRGWAVDERMGYTDLPEGGGENPSHPVHTVSWFDAVKWANARSERDGLTPVYYTTAAFTTLYKTGTDTPHPNWSANGYRLPTEAEWERAARGGVEGRRFPWADANTIQHARANYLAGPAAYTYDTSPTADFHPDYNDGFEPHTSPVGSFAPNGYGLYDMAGNVFEWCWDWYNSTYYQTSPDTDPRGPAGGENRVLRGGSWITDAGSCRSAQRMRNHPILKGTADGFRLSRAVP